MVNLLRPIGTYFVPNIYVWDVTMEKILFSLDVLFVNLWRIVNVIYNSFGLAKSKTIFVLLNRLNTGERQRKVNNRIS